jgi:hypothetical protein
MYVCIMYVSMFVCMYVLMYACTFPLIIRGSPDQLCGTGFACVLNRLCDFNSVNSNTNMYDVRTVEVYAIPTLRNE